MARARQTSFLAAAAISNLFGVLGSTPSGDLNSTCFTFSPLILWLAASRLSIRLRGPEGLPYCRCVGLHVASRLSIRLRGPEGLPCCRLHLRGPEGLPCCWRRCFGLSFYSWLAAWRVLRGSDPQLRLRLRSSLVRRWGLLLRSSLGAPPSLSDLFDCAGLSFRPPSLRIRLGALSP